MAFQESNEFAGFHDADCEAAMATTDDTLDALFEMDRFVRLMAVASGTAGIVAVVRAYLAGWSKTRVRRLQATDAGWAPFDEHQQPRNPRRGIQRTYWTPETPWVVQISVKHSGPGRAATGGIAGRARTGSSLLASTV